MDGKGGETYPGAGTQLDDAEMDIVEAELAKAWLHRMIYCKGDRRAPFDLVSCREVTFGPMEMLDIQAAAEESDGLGVFAIFFKLRLAPPREYVVGCLSIVPPRVLAGIKSQASLRLPSALLSTYPPS